jgi:hypothetical protein
LLANLLVIRNPKFTKNVGLSLLLVVFALPLTQTWSAFVLTTSSTNSANGEYREFLRSMSTGNSYDEQEFAAKVAMDVKREIPPIFYGWTIYPKTPTFLGAIDSAQLWGYSCYKCMVAGIPTERSYPPFSKEDLIELSKRDYILIFDTSKVGYDRMKSSLLTLSPKFELGAEKTIKGKSNILYYSYIYTGLER